jgi:hypothetical protein
LIQIDFLGFAGVFQESPNTETNPVDAWRLLFGDSLGLGDWDLAIYFHPDAP